MQTRLHVDSQIRRKFRKLIDSVDTSPLAVASLSLELEQQMQPFAFHFFSRFVNQP